MKFGSLRSVHQNFKILAGKQAKRGIFKEGKKNIERETEKTLTLRQQSNFVAGFVQATAGNKQQVNPFLLSLTLFVCRLEPKSLEDDDISLIDSIVLDPDEKSKLN